MFPHLAWPTHCYNANTATYGNKSINPLIFLPCYFCCSCSICQKWWFLLTLLKSDFTYLSCCREELGYNFPSNKMLLQERKEQSFIQGGASSDEATTHRNENFVVILAGLLWSCPSEIVTTFLSRSLYLLIYHYFVWRSITENVKKCKVILSFQRPHGAKVFWNLSILWI